MLAKLWKRITSREFLIYIAVGLATTAVNSVVFALLFERWGDKYTHLANFVAFVVAVIFSFLANKPLVFKSNCWRFWVVSREFFSFTLTRVGTFILEELGLVVFQDIMNMGEHYYFGINGLVYAKLLLGLVVFLLNYVLSILVFRRQTKKYKG